MATYGGQGGLREVGQFNSARNQGRVYAVQDGNQYNFFYQDNPPYVVEPFDVKPIPVHAKRASSQPSWYLSARSKIVPWFPRNDDVSSLTAWRDDPSIQAPVRLIHGPGGQGKTRLAAEFAELSINADWAVLSATHLGQLGDFIADDRRLTFSGQGLLIIVDYAERWSTSDVRTLVAQHRKAARLPIRILILARAAGRWWQSVRDALDQFDQPAVFSDAMNLPPLARTVASRTQVFTSARDSFAKVLGLADATTIPPPDDLDSSAYGLVLTIHMAALAAVEAYREGTSAPTEPGGLAAYLLARERREWGALYDRGFGAFTEPTVMAQVVYVATLTRPLTGEDGGKVLSRVRLASTHPEAAKILRDHAVCYPPMQPGTVLEPLYPDRLGEDFLALQTPGHSVDYPVDDQWAPTAVAKLLGTEDRQQVPSYASKVFAVLLETAYRWRHMAQRHLYPLLRQYPELAVAAGAATLSRLLELPEVDPDALAAVDAYLTDPDGVFDIELQEVAAELAEHVLEWRLGHATASVGRADVYADFGRKMRHAGRYEEARDALSAAAEIYQEVYTGSDAYGAEFAMILTDLSYQLADLDDLEEAHARAEQAIAVWAQIPGSEETRPKDVAESYNALGYHLSGREAERTRSAFERALYLRKRMPAADKMKYILVAASLLNISIAFSYTTQWDDAKKYAKESVETYRAEIEAGHRGQGRIGIRRALSSLALAQWQSGELTDAVQISREAAQQALDLARASPMTSSEELFDTLSTLRSRLRFMGRIDDALILTEDVAAFFGKVASERGIVTAKENVGVLFGELGRGEKATDFTREVVETYGRLLETDRSHYQVNLVRALLTLSWHQWEGQADDDAVDTADRAVQICRHMSDEDRAMTLQYLGDYLARMGRYDEARAATEKVVEIYRRLVDSEPQRYRVNLVAALRKLAEHWKSQGKRENAGVTAREAVHVCRQMTHLMPDAQGNLGRALNILGEYQWELAQHDAAIATIKAVGIYRSLAGSRPAEQLNVASSLLILGSWLDRIGNHGEARLRSEEGIQICVELADMEPGFRPSVADILRDEGLRMEQLGRDDDALSYISKAVALYGDLADADTVVETSLIHSLGNQARLFLKFGHDSQARGISHRAAGRCQHLAHRHLPRKLIARLQETEAELMEILNRLGQAEDAATIQSILNGY